MRSRAEASEITSLTGRRALTLDQAAERVQAVRDSGAAVNPRCPCDLPRRADRRAGGRAFILEHTRGVHGFFGASSIERLAVERAITEQTRAFKLIMKRRQT